MVIPAMRPAANARERASSLPLVASRTTTTSGGAAPTPVVDSPVTTVRPSGANATSVVVAFDADVRVQRGARVPVATREVIG
jgi:hypothetical protein